MNTHGNGSTVLQFSEVVRRGIVRAEMCDEHRANSNRACKPLFEFMTSRGVEAWADLGVEHVREYVAHLKQKGMAPATIRAYTNPLRIAWRENRTRFEEEPIDMRGLLPERKTPPKKYLPLNKLVAVIKCAREQQDRAATIGFVAGGLAGLRITEIMRLQPGDVDVRNKTLAVQGVTKNDASRRVIPVCGYVVDVLEEHFAYRQVSYKAVTTFSHRMRWCLNQVADDTGDETFRLVAPKDAGRKTFSELGMEVVQESGCDKDLLRAYLGHAFPAWDVLHRNYSGLVPRPDDMPHVQEKAIARLRKAIVEPLEAQIKNLL
jgi:integrase